jgi:hypothetical protein
MSGHWPPEWEDPEEEFPEEADQLEADAQARLSEVTAYLASVPAPVMPENVAARIGAALTAEAAARADATTATSHTAAATTAGSPTATATDGSATATKGSTTATKGPADAAVGDATAPADDAAAHESAAGPPDGSRTLGPVPARARVGRNRRRRLRISLPKAVGSLAVCLVLAGLGFGLAQGGISNSSSSSSAASSGPLEGTGSRAAPAASASSTLGLNHSFVVTRSGTRYEQATLAAQVHTRLTTVGEAPKGPVTVPGPHSSASSAGSSSVNASPPGAALSACVLHLTGGTPPRLVDRATYGGEPAYIIAGSSRVWVVGLGCTAAKPQLIASVPLAG